MKTAKYEVVSYGVIILVLLLIDFITQIFPYKLTVSYCVFLFIACGMIINNFRQTFKESSLVFGFWLGMLLYTVGLFK